MKAVIYHNLRELYQLRGRDSFEQLERAVYKYTSCGAWIEKIRGGVRLGSIVEGTDTEVEPITLKFPFTSDDFDGAILKIDAEADHIWNETHGCDECGLGEGEYGGLRVNPECKKCRGQGEVI